MTEIEQFLAGIVVAIRAQLMSRADVDGRRSLRPRRGGEHGMELIQAVILAAGLAVAALGVVAILAATANDTARNITTK